MRLFRPGFFSGWLYPEAIFRLKAGKKVLCLTFDDGPDPDSTKKILEILARKNIKAIFFCNGKVAEKYPDIIVAIKLEGHLVGNHGHEHMDGWTSSLESFMNNVTLAEPFTSNLLFRPPYGHLRLNQYRKLRSSYMIMLWDLMPFDFDNSFGAENTLRVLKEKIRPGSVIVLHDTAQSSAITILDDFIEFSSGAGYRFILPQLNEK